MRALFALVLLFAVLTPQPSWADVAKGQEIYGKLCASCHGPGGAGDGPIAMGLPPEQKPRNFTTGEFKIASDDIKMKDVIKKGGIAFGLSPLMAPQPALSDDDLTALVSFVRSLKK